MLFNNKRHDQSGHPTRDILSGQASAMGMQGDPNNNSDNPDDQDENAQKSFQDKSGLSGAGGPNAGKGGKPKKTRNKIPTLDMLCYNIEAAVCHPNKALDFLRNLFSDADRINQFNP